MNMIIGLIGWFTVINLCKTPNEIVERVDFYDKKSKTLIKMPVADAKTMYSNLINNGVISLETIALYQKYQGIALHILAKAA